MVTIQSKHQPAHHTNGLTWPPNFSPAGGPSADLVYTSERHLCQADSWFCVHLPVEFNTQPPAIAARADSLRRSVGGISEVCSLPLTSSQSQRPPQTVRSTVCIQGTCPNLNINIDKPLHSFILLSLRLCISCSQPSYNMRGLHYHRRKLCPVCFLARLSWGPS